jgi:hypothetical protein
MRRFFMWRDGYNIGDMRTITLYNIDFVDENGNKYKLDGFGINGFWGKVEGG